MEAYRTWKTDMVMAPLTRTGIKVERFEEPVFLAPSTRRRSSMAALKTKDRIILGYNETRSHKIIDIQACLVLTPPLDTKLQELRPYLPHLLPDNKICDITLQHIDGTFDLVLTGPFTFGRYEQDEALGELATTLDIARIAHRPRDFSQPEILLSRAPVQKKFGQITVNIPPGAFLQASDEGESALTRIVATYADGACNIADLFAGCGTFSGALMKAGRNIIAYDGDEAAISALAKVIPAHRRDLFKNPVRANELSAFDCAVFDPPRAGGKEQACQLAKSGLSKIIGVSCNPATFARDAKILQDSGYSLHSLSLVDQFVWSNHIEVVGAFTKDV